MPTTLETLIYDPRKQLPTRGEVKLTAQIKLLPTKEQAESLRETLEVANAACNRLSLLAWGAKEFRQFPMHRMFYRQLRQEFTISAQMVVRIIAKVAHSYNSKQKSPRAFRSLGSIPYDRHILNFKLQHSAVSIWSVSGRIKGIPFVCGERQRNLIALRRGESDLILRGAEWFLNVVVDVPETKERESSEWLGVDLGLVNIAKDSEGQTYGNARKLAGPRARRLRQRKRLQSKRTQSAKRVLRRLSGRESRFVSHENHVISKQIVAEAERTGMGVALEDLRGIRARIRARKSHRRILHSWAFRDLQSKIAYKGRLVGVPVKFVDARNTSRTCPACGHASKHNRPTRDLFACDSCGFTADADTNAAREISRRAVAIPPNERKASGFTFEASSQIANSSLL